MSTPELPAPIVHDGPRASEGHTICPNCGYSLKPDATLSRGRWTLSPHQAFYDGQRLALRPAMYQVLHTLARAHPHVISSYALNSRISQDASSTAIAVTICNLRRTLRTLQVPVPIRTVRGGYTWSDEPVEHREYKRGGMVHGH